MKQIGLLHTLKHLAKGQTLARIRMNQEFLKEHVRGNVVDVGGGRKPDYFHYLKKTNADITPIDASISKIDFETDPLPLDDKSVDTVVCCNVLEHVFNHRFLLAEMHRILKEDGGLVGFVPFWTGYHADPHDYFRYTHEALLRLLQEAGFKNAKVRAVSVGPILANFNTIVLSMPRVVRPIVYLFYAAMNALFIRLRPASIARQPLGYIFTA